MQRRTFLGSIAAAVGGLWAGRPLLGHSAKGERPTPMPRWEWEVGVWRPKCFRMLVLADINSNPIVNSAGDPFNDPPYFDASVMEREWAASAIISYEDAVLLVHACSACNASSFLGVASGYIQIESVGGGSGRFDGLVKCHVRLRETEHRQDGVEVLDYRCKTSWHQHSKLVNFYDVFRGGHAVVSVGGEKLHEEDKHWQIVSLECPRE